MGTLQIYLFIFFSLRNYFAILVYVALGSQKNSFLFVCYADSSFTNDRKGLSEQRT